MSKVKFKIPDTIRHEEVSSFMRNVVKKLNAENTIDVTDIPQLHRMATSYDDYLTACDWIAEHGAVTTNIKGEKVKHPYANLQKESWNQFLVLAKEYGLTIKSRGQIKSVNPSEKEPESPFEAFKKGKKQA